MLLFQFSETFFSKSNRSGLLQKKVRYKGGFALYLQENLGLYSLIDKVKREKIIRQKECF